jgi:hypothetical protein
MTYIRLPHPAKNPSATIQSKGQPCRGLPFLFITLHTRHEKDS